MGAEGTILRYVNGVWNSMESGTLVGLEAVWAAPTGEVFVAGTNGTVLRRLP